MRPGGSQEAVVEAGANQMGAIENPGLRADVIRPRLVQNGLAFPHHCQAALPPTLPPVWMNVLGTSPTMTVSATQTLSLTVTGMMFPGMSR